MLKRIVNPRLKNADCKSALALCELYVAYIEEQDIYGQTTIGDMSISLLNKEVKNGCNLSKAG
jgi:hypothetical protein